MKINGFIFLVLFTFIFAGEKIFRRPKIVMFGDSITEQALTIEGGSWRKIAAEYRGRLDVINRGYSGYNTHHSLIALKMLIENKDTFDPTQKTLTIIMLGSNDSVFPGGTQYINLDDYRKNLIAIVEMIKSLRNENKFLILPPVPICDKQYNELWTDYPRSNENTRKYYLVAKKVAEELQDKDVYFVDTWQNEEKEWAQDDYSMHSDGLHLTPKGYDVLVKYILETINSKIPDFNSDNIPAYPSWEDIDDNGRLKFLSQ